MGKFEVTIESKIVRLKKMVNIRSVLITILISLGVLLVISSYATVSNGWDLLLRGETPYIGDSQLKLLSMDIP
ncbi:MAG: hypothetical protein ACXU97_07835, partial [Thermodesulfobacteriota bacterium]